mmetsp:Transcript_60914/g.108176  ORF Transcript_60914/g.108176 Transcript_60914/m.108176 type:complete len:385 (-) Transcript_60914:249-1403(-)
MALIQILVLALLGQASGQTVTASPVAPVASGALNSLTFDFTLGADFSLASDTITISVAGNTENVFNVAGAGGGGGVLGAGQFTFTGQASGGGAFAGVTTVTLNDAYSLTISFDTVLGLGATQLVISDSAVLMSPQVQSVVTNFDITPSDAGVNPAQTGVTGWTVGAAVVGSDPITFYNGIRTKFWIPEDKFTPLLNTPEVRILAQPLQGPKDLQWFDRLSLTLPNGKSLVDVTTVRTEKSTPSTPCLTGACGKQIELTFGDKAQVSLYENTILFSSSDGNVKGAVYKQPYHVARTHGQNEIEHVHIETPSIAFNIYASHAGNEFPGDIAMQKKYVHLDFMIVSANISSSKFTGVLPELWEVIPRSPEVQAMTAPPSAQARLCTA